MSRVQTQAVEIFVPALYVKYNKIVSFCFGTELLFYKDKSKAAVFLIMALICPEIKRTSLPFKITTKRILNKININTYTLYFKHD